MGSGPWRAFLDRIENVCPQVYFRSRDVATRLRKSEAGYRALLGEGGMPRRYKPTGNISITDDMRHASIAACLDATRNFLTLVNEGGYEACSFWCWDSAPEEIWEFLESVDS